MTSSGAFWGKFRGKVIDNVDPLFQGRIMADVPALPGSLLNWALPCTPYAGPDVGFYAIPPIGANVWIEFEGGDPNFPIWVGCFWGPEDILHVPEPPPPEMKVFKTEFVTMILSDLPEMGGFTLKCMAPAVDVPLTMTFDSTGITLLCPESTMAMTPGSLTLSVPEAGLNMVSEGITLTVPPSAIEIGSELVSVALPASSVELTGESIQVESPAIGISGETKMAGPLTVEGAVDIAGGIAIEGGGTIDGAPIL